MPNTAPNSQAALLNSHDHETLWDGLVRLLGEIQESTLFKPYSAPK